MERKTDLVRFVRDGDSHSVGGINCLVFKKGKEFVEVFFFSHSAIALVLMTFSTQDIVEQSSIHSKRTNNKMIIPPSVHRQFIIAMIQ